MREAFAVVLFAVVGAIGCGEASVDIEAAQHGKRLNMVAGESPDSLTLVAAKGAFGVQRESSTIQFRDVAGVVLQDPHYKAQRLTQWLLTGTGDAFTMRVCPVKAEGGVDFSDCQAWSQPASITMLGLSEPIRSLSSYLFQDGSANPVLAQVVFNMAGSQRLERTCPVNSSTIDWESCSNWLALEESASQLGVPQESAFDDEVVIPYVDHDGNQSFTQQLIAPSGDSVWSRTCSTASGELPGVGGNCAFAPAERISAIGIHFAAIQGVGGYTYVDGDSQIYAQTVIAADGVSASRRLCPVTADGIAFDKCLGWSSVNIDALARHGSPL